MSKRKQLHQEGFLCLFDKQGEMFFRVTTYIDCAYHYGAWAFHTAHRVRENEQHNIVKGMSEDEDEPPRWSPAWSDAAAPLHDGNEEIDEFCFIGHFDIEYVNGDKWKYTFGKGYMSSPAGYSRLELATVDEDWHYELHDTTLFGTINLDKLRVIID
jgi:hypothetical protein